MQCLVFDQSLQMAQLGLYFAQLLNACLATHVSQSFEVTQFHQSANLPFKNSTALGRGFVIRVCKFPFRTHRPEYARIRTYHK